VSPKHQKKIHVIPNFVDAERIIPQSRDTTYRTELGIGDETVVMYAGNVGFSQSLTLMISAAKHFPDVIFVINGEGAARDHLEKMSAGITNIRFANYQPRERVSEVLASGDIHVVPLRAGLGAVSVPSKTYSILAAARPVVAAIDSGTEVTRILANSGAGIAVIPDSEPEFVSALGELISDHARAVNMGKRGRQWVQTYVSPSAVAHSYLSLIDSL
jgi:colanic acid biosynthesis glycosyl transferase WcaI